FWSSNPDSGGSGGPRFQPSKQVNVRTAKAVGFMNTHTLPEHNMMRSLAMLPLIMSPLAMAAPTSASDIAHWTFDHPVVGDPVVTAPFTDEVQGLGADLVVQ